MGLGGQGVVMQVPDVKVHVRQVKVSGLRRTKNDIVVEQVKEVLQAGSLQSVLMESLLSMERLNSLNIFRSINLRLHAGEDKQDGTEGEGEGEGEGEEGRNRGIVVTFEVREKGWFKTSVGANVGTQSGDANLSMNVHNVFGRAEQASIVSSTTFPHWGQSTQFQFTKPYYKDIDNTFHLSLGTTHTKHPFSGFQERTTGPAVAVRFPSHLGMHSLSWNGDWRKVYGFSYDVPMSIREQAGHSLKSAIKHTLEVDERDDAFLPSSGYHVKMSQEVAGLGGDVFFGKTDLQSSFYLPLPAGWVFCLSLWGGVLRPYSNNHLVDRFLLGGGTTLRGFGMWGVGPRDRGYSRGGEAYWASGVHLFSPLPFISNELIRRIKIHSFLTTGNLIESPSLSHLRGLVRGVRVSCGVGLYLRLGVAQIELNYAVPLLAKNTDKLQPGLQFGIGMDML